MSLDKVQSALTEGVQSVLSGWEVAYPNRELDNKPKPTDAAKWANVSFLPNTPGRDGRNGLGEGGRDYTTGLVQVDLNYTTNSGDAAGRADYERLRDAFPKGSAVTYDGQEVSITSTGRSPGRTVESWFRISVTINWYARIPR